MSKKHIHKILIANRGEIACRIIRTCKKLGIATLAIYSEGDANGSFVKQADEAVLIGPSEVALSYLNMDKILHIAKERQVDAIHPGYGFLSENALFSKRCEEEGIIFIGPRHKTIESMGSKVGAKKLLSEREPSIPLIPGYNGDDQSIENLSAKALQIGFPVLLKASAGGGGKGMRIVREESELKNAIDSAKSEARNSFGDDFMLIEKYFDTVKHIEFQIFGDNYGNVIHLFERECSVQRRHQKVIEESPSPVMTTQLRDQMGKAAVTIGKLINYIGAGTVEFIVDDKGKFYFLEVNTRLQVEHPVTEMITGLDLVDLQIQVAQGYSLAELGIPSTDVIKPKGHAIQCRVYAEDPANNFFPCIGTISKWKQSTIPGIRYDTGIESGSAISIYYDPMVSKVISYAETREIAIAKMIKALHETVILGLKTNKRFLQQLLAHPNFHNGKFDTHFIQNYFPDKVIKQPFPVAEDSLIAGFLYEWAVRNSARELLKNLPSGFRNSPYKFQQVTLIDVDTNKEYLLEYNYTSNRFKKDQPHTFTVKLGNLSFEVVLVNEITSNSDTLVCAINGVRRFFCISMVDDKIFVHSDLLGEVSLSKKNRLPDVEAQDTAHAGYTAPMPGKVLKVSVKDGDKVKKGDLLVTLFSMKMEHKIYAQMDGVVKVFVKENQIADAGQSLVSVE